jgi:alcohol dehydrogenase class IV
MASGFEFYTAARIVFAEGALGRLEQLASGLGGGRCLLIVGADSAARSGLLTRLSALLEVGAIVRCGGEPSVVDIDLAVQKARQAGCQLVVAAGGGSVLDCGKAVSGLLTNPGSVLDYLEGVGRGQQITQPAAPLIAIPTTAGTGSEVTKNAVISGEGFKKSIRSPLLIPRIALVDPELTISLPAKQTAACGMDALTQLIESYLSIGANPLSDALALDGIRRAGEALWRVYKQPGDRKARHDMALASLLGGICLANAGLGAVHGFASPLGAFFPIPHGVACAALLPQTIKMNLEASRGRPEGTRIFARFAQVAETLCEQSFEKTEQAVEVGLSFLFDLQRDLEIPRLSAYGLDSSDARRKVVENARGSSMKFNPITLSDAQLDSVLVDAL